VKQVEKQMHNIISLNEIKRKAMAMREIYELRIKKVRRKKIKFQYSSRKKMTMWI
jgi:hypothetical protein